MDWFKVRYISGFQDKLKQEHEEVLQAASLREALARFSDWPVEVRYNCTTAWAKNPGTSLYYVEAWEAEHCAAPEGVRAAPEAEPRSSASESDFILK